MSIELDYSHAVPRAQRRALGQFFTPPALARLMAGWCLAGGARQLFDPAIGTGILVREALELCPELQISGADRDPAVLQTCAALLGRRAELRCADFLLEPPAQYYEAIISNPPYLGYKSLPYPPSIFEHFDARCRLRVNRQSNLYVFFILAISLQLAPRGRAAILVPSDWLNGNFGVPLKSYLLREGLLDGVVVFEHTSLMFDETLATACLLLLRRGREADAPVRFAHVAGEPGPQISDLDQLIAQVGRAVDYSPQALRPEHKWLALLPELEQQPEAQAHGLLPLHALAQVRRGIATGANDFFLLSAAQAERLGLEPELLKPCLTRAGDAPGLDLTQQDLQRLLAAGRQVLLLDVPQGQPSPALARYLRAGEEQGISQRYLPAHRRPWYRSEQRAPAPILVTTFARGRARFVFNRPLLRYLTAFHGITLHPALQSQDWLYERVLLAYLVSPLGARALRPQQRRYGDGLLKHEPADIAGTLVPDLRQLSSSSLEELAQLFERCCAEQRGGKLPASLALLEQRWQQLLQLPPSAAVSPLAAS